MKDTFINGIRDVEIQRALKLGRYESSSEALVRALEYQAVLEGNRTSHQVRRISFSDNANNELLSAVKKLTEVMERRRLSTSQPRKGRTLRCYECGECGHRRKRDRSPESRPHQQTNEIRSSEQRLVRVIRPVVMDEADGLTKIVSVPSLKKSSDSLVLEGQLLRSRVVYTVDTEAAVSIVRADLCKAEDIRRLNGRTMLTTAMGETACVHG